MYVRPYEEQLMVYPEYRAHKLLLLYVPPLLLVLGTLGNILSFCVLMRKAMRRTSTYNYLAVLAATDLVVLYVGLLRLWIGELIGYDIRDQSDWSCKIISLLGYTVSVYSVWLLIAVTVERFTVVVYSLHAATWCTRTRALKVICGILVALLSINLHFLFTTEIVYYDNEDGERVIPQCDAAAGYETLVMEVWPWIDACLYSLLPFIIIFVLNVLIIHKVVLARRARHSMSGRAPLEVTALRGGGGGGHSAESSAKVTVMLLTISFTFLLTTLPMNAQLITTALMGSQAPTLALASKFKLARTVSELLMYTNHSVNFYLYLLTGAKFRQQLLTICCPALAAAHRHSHRPTGGRGATTGGYSGVYSQVTHTTADTSPPGKVPPAGQTTELVILNNGSYMAAGGDRML